MRRHPPATIEALGLASFPLVLLGVMAPRCWRERSLAGRAWRTAVAAVLVYLGSLLAAWL